LDRSEGDEGYERCDDQNQINEDDCLNTCQPAACGDGVVRSDLAEGEEGFERCDDGDADETNECKNDCMF
jgi:hypothetical protein